MNTNTAMIPYNPVNICIPPWVLLLFSFLTVITLYSLMKSTDAEPVSPKLRIKIPTPVESPVATPSPPPRKLIPPPAPTRPKKVYTTEELSLDDKILRFLRFNPGVNATIILRAMKGQDHLLTKHNINSCLYSMLYRKLVAKEDGLGGPPGWFPMR
jgi:hypothetical protein